MTLELAQAAKEVGRPTKEAAAAKAPPRENELSRTSRRGCLPDGSRKRRRCTTS